MLKIFARARVGLALAAALAFLPLLKAQPSSDAPKPAQILTARTIFVSNASAECPSLYCGSPDQPYNQFYASMKSWGTDGVPGGSRLDLRNTFLPRPAW
jgi:hypothetical protein